MHLLLKLTRIRYQHSYWQKIDSQILINAVLYMTYLRIGFVLLFHNLDNLLQWRLSSNIETDGCCQVDMFDRPMAESADSHSDITVLQTKVEVLQMQVINKD